jgi:hypothetical protein
MKSASVVPGLTCANLRSSCRPSASNDGQGVDGDTAPEAAWLAAVDTAITTITSGVIVNGTTNDPQNTRHVAWRERTPRYSSEAAVRERTCSGSHPRRDYTFSRRAPSNRDGRYFATGPGLSVNVVNPVHPARMVSGRTWGSKPPAVTVTAYTPGGFATAFAIPF